MYLKLLIKSWKSAVRKRDDAKIRGYIRQIKHTQKGYLGNIF
jgi:hypothetical protein